jgi:hypothetical protein
VFVKQKVIMKHFIASVLCALSFCAGAQTMVLAPASCSSYRICSTVQTEPVSENIIAIYANVLEPGVSVTLNGVTYTSPSGNGASIVGLVLVATDSSTLTLDAEFVHYRRLNRSGHNYYISRWALVGGTISLP